MKDPSQPDLLKPVRVRFAPSPTGHLHVGGARTAIFNWLFARHHGGAFIVRVEDTDQARSTLEAERMVLDDLRWLGLEWDEGPDVGGAHSPYRQSERREVYAAAAEQLLSSDHVYRCFCSEEELERKRKGAEAESRPPHYDLTCHRLTADERRKREESGAASVVRFHVPKQEGAAFDGDVTIDDLIRGEVTWKKESLGDFIVIRSDGMPTYNFSVVVDDHAMEISHVIRAEEHLTNTHRQVLLYRAFGWKVPQFAHVSIILAPDRTKLSKRHGATSVSAYAGQGFLPDAMLNYLTLLGWSSPESEEIFSRQFAIENFSLGRVNPAAAIFDLQKFSWLNAQYISALGAAELGGLVLPLLRDAGLVTEESAEVLSWVDELTGLVRQGLHRLEELVPAVRFVFEREPQSLLVEGDALEILTDPSARKLVELLEGDLREHGAPVTPEEYHALADRLKAASGLKGKKLFMPIRVAITGSTHGPELYRVIPLLEKGSRLAGIAEVLSPLERVAKVARTLKDLPLQGASDA